VAGDNRSDWQNVQVLAQFSPSIDELASEKCKHSSHKNHSPALVAWSLRVIKTMKILKTQVAIIGAGPSGLLLGPVAKP
jgi:hypothetical protein